MSITETLKAKLDELEIEKHLNQLAGETEKIVDDALAKAGGLAHDRRDEIGGWLEKATSAINERTEGKYADQVAKVREGLQTQVDKLAAMRPLPGEDAAPTQVSEPPAVEAPHDRPTDPPLS